MTKQINIRGIIKCILVFLLFYYSSLLQWIPVIFLKIDINRLNNSMSVMLSSFSNIILLLILFFIFRKELRKEWVIFKNKLSDNLDIGFKYWLCGLMGMIISNLILVSFFQAGQAGNEKTVQTMIQDLPWLMLIDAGILAPFIEEIVFRKCFKNIFKNKWLFILTSGLVFGGIHVIHNINTWVDILFIVPYSCLGFAFAASYYKTDTIFTSISIHMFHNIILTLISILI